jgi:hypothetical protein
VSAQVGNRRALRPRSNACLTKEKARRDASACANPRRRVRSRLPASGANGERKMSGMGSGRDNRAPPRTRVGQVHWGRPGPDGRYSYGTIGDIMRCTPPRDGKAPGANQRRLTAEATTPRPGRLPDAWAVVDHDACRRNSDGGARAACIPERAAPIAPQAAPAGHDAPCSTRHSVSITTERTSTFRHALPCTAWI